MKKEEEIVKLEEMLHQNFNDFYNPEVKEVATKLNKLISHGKDSLKSKYKRAFIDTLKFLSELEYLEKIMNLV